jgi:hypothetical protein
MHGKSRLGSQTAGALGASAQPEQSPKWLNVSAAQVHEILEAQGKVCPLSGRKLTPATAAIDYIVPIGRGGKPEASNMRVVHVDVRAAKGSLLDAEFIALCAQVAADADRLGGASA